MASLKRSISQEIRRSMRKKKISIPMYPNGLETAKSFVKPKNRNKE
uniref:AsIV-cont00101-ORF1 n=1 Tax=Apophua simplicipes ichnovirus TaxID=1329648 RepID=S5DT37_9VIRU|nr:AsIV-cont00101-ORF1 [Apophua simplicipes ichnovirus]